MGTIERAHQEAATAAGGGIVQLLHPGDVRCADRGTCLETLLGSCVAILLTDPRRSVGAMCHIVHCPAVENIGRGDTAFGSAALALMYTLLETRGIAPRLCEAYVFGGGNMFPSLFCETHVGQANAAWALAALAADGITVLRRDVGGAVYRRVRWTIGPGDPEVMATASGR